MLDSRAIHPNMNSIRTNSTRKELVKKMTKDIMHINDTNLPSNIANDEQAVKLWVIQKSLESINQQRLSIINSITNE